MRTAQYLRAERAISAADINGIRQRWMWGLRLLRDPEAFAPKSTQLKPGRADQLVTVVKANGMKLSTREIQYRLTCARTYQTEAQIAQASAEFETWSDLIKAGFPTYEADPAEPPADHRTPDERERDMARRLLDLVGEQGSLFPLDRFEPTASTLKELVDYAEQQESLTARFVEHGQKRRDYLTSLADAVDGDLSSTWQAAHQAAFGDDPIDGTA